MAITLYTGVPGTGKTHALVGEIIVPAVRAGRRVLTNVEGVDPDKVRAYCAGKWPDSADTLGEVVLFDGEATVSNAAAFFPGRDEADGETFLHPGDLFVMDEVRLYWPRRGTKLPVRIVEFLRLHRHFVSSAGQSTDVVLATQLSTDCHEDFKGCIERSYRFRKLKAVGMNNRYTWLSWEGADQRKGQQVANGGGKYRPEIFALYSSYKGTGGMEKATDRRENLFAQPKFLVMAVVTVVVFVGSMFWVWRFFHPAAAKAAVVASAASVPTGAVGAGGPSGAAPLVGGAVAGAGYAGAPVLSMMWRISGVVQTPGMNVVVLVDRSGNLRYEDPSGFTLVDGRPTVGIVDGQRVLAVGMQAQSSPSPSFASAPVLGR